MKGIENKKMSWLQFSILLVAIFAVAAIVAYAQVDDATAETEVSPYIQKMDSINSKTLTSTALMPHGRKFFLLKFTSNPITLEPAYDLEVKFDRIVNIENSGNFRSYEMLDDVGQNWKFEDGRLFNGGSIGISVGYDGRPKPNIVECSFTDKKGGVIATSKCEQTNK